MFRAQSAASSKDPHSAFEPAPAVFEEFLRRKNPLEMPVRHSKVSRIRIGGKGTGPVSAEDFKARSGQGGSGMHQSHHIHAVRVDTAENFVDAAP